MSKKERLRLEAFSRVCSGEWTLKMASVSLGLSYRQTKRVWARYRSEGDEGLTHRSRGRASSRRIAEELRERAVSAMRDKYPDFGPTLIAEYLAKEEDISVSVSTVRRWRSSAGLPPCCQRRAPKHRSRRARKEHFGELVQLDGSHHDWFEGRRDKACLMVMIDDATGRVVARFHEVESSAASFDVFGAWVQKYGLPARVYPDRHSIYRTDREATSEEALAGVDPTTQFGRALAELDVRLSLASSPQAKGRVERMNGTLQDRLVKELRLRGVSTLESANKLLASGWLDELSERFEVKANNASDFHRPAPARQELAHVLARWETRDVGRDAVVRWSNRYFQLKQDSRIARLADHKATVVSREDDVLAIRVCGHAVSFTELPAAPARKPKATGPRGVGSPATPSKKHAWREPIKSPHK